MSTAPPRLSVRGISKTFAQSQVLSEVNLDVFPGEIHGLVGQNGSGKSTLIKILTGYHQRDPEGEYLINETDIGTPVRWKDVHAAGLTVVHQDLGLLDQLSVAENICVGSYPTTQRLRRIDRRAQNQIAATVLARLGVGLSPSARVGGLSASERSEVAIARAMRDQSPDQGLIILDEATRTLSGEDLERFHGLLRRIAAAGGSVLLVSHNLNEVMELTSRITILRDGRAVVSGTATGSMSEQEVATYMLGQSLVGLARRPRWVAKRPVAARVQGLAGATLHDATFDVHAGEVVGVTGLPGSGYEEIPYLITGARPARAGTLAVGGRTIDLRRATVRTGLRAGMCLVPERRDRDGIAFDQSVRDNVSLPQLRRRGHTWFVGRRWQERLANRVITDLDVKPRRSTLLVKELSGGNQQKVLLGKWLSTGAKVLVLHEPTQAVDVGARADIYRALHRAADNGVGVVVVTGDPTEIVDACDRALSYSSTSGLTEMQAETPEAVLDQLYSVPQAAKVQEDET